jgi:hypothetical protein
MLSMLAVLLAGQPLTLQIDSPQKKLLVGEPWKLVVTWTGDLGPREAVQTGIEALRLYVDDGSGEKVYREDRYRRPGDPITDYPTPVYRLHSGELLRENFVFVTGRHYSAGESSLELPVDPLLFPRAGRYTVRAMQERWAAPPMWSKKLSVTVNDPKGSDREVRHRVRGHERVLVDKDTPGSESALDDLLASHPHSPYLVWSRLRRMQESPEANHPEFRRLLDEARGSSEPHASSRVLEDFRHRLVREVLAFERWGLYEEDAWAFALTQAQETEDAALQSRIRADILRKYPQSAAANAIARAEREEAARADE